MRQQGIAAKAGGERERPTSFQKGPSLHFQPLDLGIQIRKERPDPVQPGSGHEQNCIRTGSVLQTAFCGSCWSSR